MKERKEEESVACFSFSFFIFIKTVWVDDDVIIIPCNKHLSGDDNIILLEQKSTVYPVGNYSMEPYNADIVSSARSKYNLFFSIIKCIKNKTWLIFSFFFLIKIPRYWFIRDRLSN